MALMEQKQALALAGGDWRAAAMFDLSSRLMPPSEFPCTFSQNAFRRHLLWLSFIDTPGPEGVQAAAQDLKAYVDDSRWWDGRVDTARPLVMVFSSQVVQAVDLAGYHDFGWRLLQAWHSLDTVPWPDDVALDPMSPYWSFCFAGMQLFVNMSAPAHHARRSRNLGQNFTLVINPRARFDMVAGNTTEGQRLRDKIRSRAEAYDRMPHSPLLGSYQKGDLEALQYALPDSNGDKPGLCPFRVRPAELPG